MGIIYYSTIPRFEAYFQPKSIGEAISLLVKYAPEAKILAGGTDLLPLMRARAVMPKCIIDITRIPKLDYISYEERNKLRIGACTTLSAVQQSKVVKEKYFLLYEAIHQMATIQIKNMGTITGNICRAAPSADTVPPLLVLGAEVKIVGPAETRIVPLGKFFIGPGETILKDNEMVTEIQVPLPPEGSGMAFLRVKRTAHDLAKVNIASIITLKNSICEDAKIALGSVAPTAVRATKVEEALRGRELENGVIERAAERVAEDIKPISDIRSTEEYRREISKVLVKRAIKMSISHAKEGGNGETKSNVGSK